MAKDIAALTKEVKDLEKKLAMAEHKRTESERKLADLQHQLNEKLEIIEEGTKELLELQGTLADRDETIELGTRQLKDLEEKLKKANEPLVTLQGQFDTQKNELEQAKKDLKEKTQELMHAHLYGVDLEEDCDLLETERDELQTKVDELTAAPGTLRKLPWKTLGILAAVVLLLMFGAFVYGWSSRAGQTTSSSEFAALKKANADVVRLNKELEQSKKDLEEFRNLGSDEALKKQVTDLEAAKVALENEKTALETAKATLESEKTELEKQLAEAKADATVNSAPSGSSTAPSASSTSGEEISLGSDEEPVPLADGKVVFPEETVNGGNWLPDPLSKKRSAGDRSISTYPPDLPAREMFSQPVRVVQEPEVKEVEEVVEERVSQETLRPKPLVRHVPVNGWLHFRCLICSRELARHQGPCKPGCKDIAADHIQFDHPEVFARGINTN